MKRNERRRGGHPLPGRQLPSRVVESHLRAHFLAVVEALAPQVLLSLEQVRLPFGLRAWSRHWHLTARWCLEAAVETRHEWADYGGPRTWSVPSDGWWAIEETRTPSPGVLKEEEHFRWLVRYQVLGETFTSVANAMKATRGAQFHANHVRDACQRLARQLDLQLRRSPRGRPRGRTVKSYFSASRS